MDNLHLRALSPAQRARTIEWLLAMLTHTQQCDRTNCNIRLCAYVSNLVDHARTCHVREEEHCHTCWYYILFCKQHSESCALIKCSLPFCKEIKRRRQQKTLQQTQQPTSNESVESQQKELPTTEENRFMRYMPQLFSTPTVSGKMSPVVEHHVGVKAELPMLHMPNGTAATAAAAAENMNSEAMANLAPTVAPHTQLSEGLPLDYSMKTSFEDTAALALESFYELNPINLDDSEPMLEVSSTDYEVFTPASSTYGPQEMFNELVDDTLGPIKDNFKIYRQNGVVHTFDDCIIEDNGAVSPVNEIWQTAYLDWNKKRDKNKKQPKVSIN